MFPIAEWAVRNFWFLLAERTPVAPSAAWLRRHSIAAAREGNSLPDLRLHSDDGAVIAEWYADERLCTGQPVRFVASGSEELSPAIVHQQLVELVDSILDSLLGLHSLPVLAEYFSMFSLAIRYQPSAIGKQGKTLERPYSFETELGPEGLNDLIPDT